MDIKLTVLLPIHCNSHLIFKSINSLLNQSYNNFNIYILIDGENENFIEFFKKEYSHEINNKKLLFIIL